MSKHTDELRALADLHGTGEPGWLERDIAANARKREDEIARLRTLLKRARDGLLALRRGDEFYTGDALLAEIEKEVPDGCVDA